MASPSPVKPGDTLADKYIIDASIGAGGFSHVFAARHEAMERTVAIKVFDPQHHGSDDPSRTAGRALRFEQEARLVSQLGHPNTVTLYDFGIDNHRAYLVMEFVDGQTLEQRVKAHGALDPDEAISIILQVLASLEEAHHNQILHRDLKPANIMLTRNFKGEQVVKVLDFGIAQILTGDTDDDGEPLFLGTPRYAAPEQIFSQKLTYATDIYGAGSLLWYALAGKPMVPTSDIKRCAAIAKLDPPWRFPDDIDIGQGLRRVLEKAVAKQPDRRYQNAPTFAQALQEATTIDLDDLPEFKPSSRRREQATIVDPNVIDADDSENIFLNPDAAPPPPAPYAALRQSDPSRLPPSHRQPTSSKPSRPSRDPTPIPLDAPNPPASSPPPTEPSPPAASRPQPLPDDSDGGPDKRLLAGVAVAVIAGALGFFLLWPGDDEPQATDASVTESAEASDEEISQPDEPQRASLADSSRFSVDGLLTAMRSAGWRVSNPGDPRPMRDYTMRSTVIDVGGERIDLTIYEVDEDDTHERLRRNVDPPDRYLVLDHIFLRITPRNREAFDQTRELRSFLQDFRDEVIDASN